VVGTNLATLAIRILIALDTLARIQISRADFVWGALRVAGALHACETVFVTDFVGGTIAVVVATSAGVGDQIAMAGRGTISVASALHTFVEDLAGPHGAVGRRSPAFKA